MNGISVGKLINNEIQNCSAVTKYIGTKIYPIIAPADTTYPYCVYRRDNVVPQYCKDGCYQDDVNITIIAVSNNYFQSIDLANAIRVLFEGMKGQKQSGIYVKNITLTNTTEQFAEDAYLQQLQFNITMD